MNNFRRKILYLSLEICNKLLPFLALPIFARYLSTEEFGIVSNFITLFFVLSVFIGFSAESYLSINMYEKEGYELKKIVGNQLIISFLSLFVLVLMCYLLESFVFKHLGLQKGYVLLCLGSVLFSYIIKLFFILLRFGEKDWLFFLSQFILIVLNIGLALISVVIMDDKLDARLMSFFSAYFIVGVLACFYLRNRVVIVFDKQLIKDICRFGLPIVPYQLAKWGRNGVDKIIVTNLLGLGSNGLYAYSFQLANIPSFIGNGLNLELSPRLFKLLKSKKRFEVIMKFYQPYIIIILISTLAYCILILFLSDEIYLKQFQFDRILFFLLITASVFHAIALILGNYFQYFKMNRVVTKITLTCTFIGVVLNYIFTLNFGLYGTAVTFFLVELFIMIGLIVKIRSIKNIGL